MAQLIIPTATALAITYGAGATNTAIGGVFGRSLGKRVERIDHLTDVYEAAQKTFIVVAEQRKQQQEEVEARSEILSEDSVEPLSEKEPKTLQNAPMHQAADKVKTLSDEHFESALVSRQLSQLKSMRRVDKGNQLSGYAQMAMGAAQTSVATSSIGHATAIVAKTVIGFSFISSILYLGASIYGFGVALSQLSENRNKQTEINAALESIANMPENEALDSIKGTEIEMLQHSLETLKKEEALLLQQRNTQAINIVAALMSIAAMALFTAGTQGIGPIIYYALLAGSILLPLIAVGYSTFSMSEKKYIEELTSLLQKAPSTDMAKLFLQTTDAETLSDFQLLLSTIIGLGCADNETRTAFNNLFAELNHDLDQLKTPTEHEERLKSLKELFVHLMNLQQRLIREDLFCRLKVAGLSDEEISEYLPTQAQVDKLAETVVADSDLLLYADQ